MILDRREVANALIDDRTGEGGRLIASDPQKIAALT
jgi:hypothetical protein